MHLKIIYGKQRASWLRECAGAGAGLGGGSRDCDRDRDRDRDERGKCAFKWTADKVFLMRLNATTCHSAHGGMQNEAATQQQQHEQQQQQQQA